MSDAKLLAWEYISKGKLLHLATVGSAGDPWVSNVWYGFDPDKARLYFQSRGDRRHSLELVADERVAGGIVAMDLDEVGQKVSGIQFEGRGSLVEEDELNEAYEVYMGRWSPAVRSRTPIERFRSDDGPSMFRVNLNKVILFDELAFPADPRQEIDLRSANA